MVKSSNLPKTKARFCVQAVPTFYVKKIQKIQSEINAFINSKDAGERDQAVRQWRKIIRLLNVQRPKVAKQILVLSDEILKRHLNAGQNPDTRESSKAMNKWVWSEINDLIDHALEAPKDALPETSQPALKLRKTHKNFTCKPVPSKYACKIEALQQEIKMAEQLFANDSVPEETRKNVQRVALKKWHKIIRLLNIQRPTVAKKILSLSSQISKRYWTMDQANRKLNADAWAEINTLIAHALIAPTDSLPTSQSVDLDMAMTWLTKVAVDGPIVKQAKAKTIQVKRAFKEAGAGHVWI